MDRGTCQATVHRVTQCQTHTSNLALIWGGGLPKQLSGKESVCQRRRNRRCRFSPWVRKISWRRKWQPTRVVLPGKSHGQRSLEGCSSWGHRESDTTEWLNVQALRAGPLENKTLGVELNEMTDFHWSVDFIDLWELNLENHMLPWPHPRRECDPCLLLSCSPLCLPPGVGSLPWPPSVAGGLKIKRPLAPNLSLGHRFTTHWSSWCGELGISLYLL